MSPLVQPLPLFIMPRRLCCQQCPAATRNRLPGGTCVSLKSKCRDAKPQVTIRHAITNPEFECPRGLFTRAEGVFGSLVVENGQIVGWTSERKEGCGGC